MTNELVSLAQEGLTFALLLTVQLLLVLALRKPVRARLGAVACYRLWLLPLLWLPVYLLGPALLAMLQRIAASGPPDHSSFTLYFLRQFMDLDLLPSLLTVTAESTPTSDSMAGNSGTVHGWTLLAIVWACGTLALVAWHCARWLLFSRHVRGLATPLAAEERQRHGIDAHIDARFPAASLPGINSAALFGVTKPVLLLPDDFAERYDANQRHIILAHEAVHLRRKDNAWNLCALLLVALFWINPLLFVAWRYFRLDQELSCDALALRRCNDDQQKRYARTLLDSLATLRTTSPQPALSTWDNLRHITERTLMVKQHLQLVTHPATVRTSLSLLAVLGASVTLMFAELASPAATAAESPVESPVESPAASQDISESTGRILTQAIQHLNDEKFDEARASLANLRIEYLTPFERSRVHQLLFNLEMNDKDYDGAQEQLQLALESGGLNEKETAQMQYQQAQLYVREERYSEAAEALSRWIASQDDANGGAYYLLAASHYYMDEFAAALPAAQEAVERGGNMPQEAWLAMLATLHTRLGQTQQAEDVIARLGELYPASQMYRRLRDEVGQNVR